MQRSYELTWVALLLLYDVSKRIPSVGKQVEWSSRRVKIVGCQACQEWVHECEPDRFATLSQASMTGVMFAGMKEDREP